MVTTALEKAGGREDAPLSEESEREILAMVEDQLDRPNPPDTKVLYRRAMHFVDPDVRHLSLQQFNAKFPLQVKRRKARERGGQEDAPHARRRATGRRAAPGGESSENREGPAGRSDGDEPERDDGGGDRDLCGRRRRVRSILIDYARLVAGAGDRGEVIDVVTDVDEYVDRMVEQF